MWSAFDVSKCFQPKLCYVTFQYKYIIPECQNSGNPDTNMIMIKKLCTNYGYKLVRKKVEKMASGLKSVFHSNLGTLKSLNSWYANVEMGCDWSNYYASQTNFYCLEGTACEHGWNFKFYDTLFKCIVLYVVFLSLSFPPVCPSICAFGAPCYHSNLEDCC